MKNFVLNINGKILYPDQANAEGKVTVYDRSFLYGDSLYEVIRTYSGKPFQMAEHLNRLIQSAHQCYLDLSQFVHTYEDEIVKSIIAFQNRFGEKSDCYIRLIISRGYGDIGFSLKNIKEGPTFVIFIEPVEKYLNQAASAGLKIEVPISRIRNHPQALSPSIKSGNYLNNLLAYLESTQRGFDDAVLLDYEGFVTEGTTFNIFYVRNGIVCTAPLDVGILNGTNRNLVILACQKNGIPIRITRYQLKHLLQADEIFVTSTLKEVYPVTQVNKKKFKFGPMTKKLADLLNCEISRISAAL